MKLWNFDSIHKKILRKPEKLSFPLYVLRNCVYQNISLRNHRDSYWKLYRSRKISLTNSGNLVELLQHKVEGGKKVIEKKVMHIW